MTCLLCRLRVIEETKRHGVLIGKGGLYANVIRAGLMLNSTKDTVDELIEALDTAFATMATYRRLHVFKKKGLMLNSMNEHID